MTVTQLVTSIKSDFQVLASEVTLGCQGSLKAGIKAAETASIFDPSCLLSCEAKFNFSSQTYFL